MNSAAEQMQRIILYRHIEKLKEFMSDEEYIVFAYEVAKEAFFAECANLPEGEFKELCLDHFAEITDFNTWDTWE